MNLQEFVSESLIEIIAGVSDAQKRLSDTGAKINPEFEKLFPNTHSGGTNMAMGWGTDGGLVQAVDFDIAVTAIEGTETKGGIGVVAGVFALGSQGKSEESNQSISRLTASRKSRVACPRVG